MLEKKKWYKRRVYQILIVVVVLVVIGFISRTGKEEKIDFSSVVTERQDLIQSVSETGSVKADLDVNYGWEVFGRVIEVNKKVGDSVVKGDVVARLASSKQRARLSEAASSLAAARARLNLELAGAANENVRKSKSVVDQAEAVVLQYRAQLDKTRSKAGQDVIDAENALATAENNLRLAEGGDQSQIVQDAYTDLLNILKIAVTTLSNSLKESDDVLGIDNSGVNEDFKDILAAFQPNVLSSAKASYKISKEKKEVAENIVVFLNSNNIEDIDDAALKVNDAIQALRENLFYVQQTLNATSPRVGYLTQAQLDLLKSDINIALINVNTQGSNVTNGQQAVTVARNSLLSVELIFNKAKLALESVRIQTQADISIAEAQLSTQEASLDQQRASYDLLVADPRDVDLAALRAEVNRQGANVQALQDDVSKTNLVALADGVISVLDIDIGENVNAGQNVFTIISSQLSVEVDVSESDIAKVSVGDSALITLDAFGDEHTFSAEVVSIEPAETEISGVVYYKTKILFVDNDGGDIEGFDVRAGMTANVEILTDKAENQIVIPQRAIITENGKSVVRVVTNKDKGHYVEREVITGLRGNDGLIAISSGLEEGEEIITFIREDN